MAVKSLNHFSWLQWDCTGTVISMFVFPCKGRTADADCLRICHSRGVTLGVCARDVGCVHSNANGQIGAFHQWMCRFTDILSVTEHAFYHKRFVYYAGCVYCNDIMCQQYSGVALLHYSVILYIYIYIYTCLLIVLGFESGSVA